ncbi:MAG: hypothetical protein JST51_16725 [Armatimonadetes bacterium]|nr:hypothetical protein [Armatimonadota bacterium]
MTVVPILLASLTLQGAQKAPDYRVVEVKQCGLSVSVPKSWVANPKDSNLVASFKIPIPGSKNEGRMDLAYSSDQSTDVDGFLAATKQILITGGNTVEKQWKLDLMNSTMALTRFSKGGSTTVRGILFREDKSKFVLSVSSISGEFDKVEPYMQSTLETLREIKVTPAKKPAVAVEKKIAIVRPSPGKPAPLPVKEDLMAGTTATVLNLPAGSKVSKLSDSAASVTIPGINGSIIFTAYDTGGNPPSLIFQTKAAESAKLFTGSIYRIDKTFQHNPDKQMRDMVWRTGVSAKDSSPLLSCDCVVTQVGTIYLHAFYSSSTKADFTKAQAIVTKYLLQADLTQKK